MDEYGRPNTTDEVGALIARVATAEDPYALALEICGGFPNTHPFDGQLYLLWACFTDWVELNDDAEAEAFAAMRAAASEWPSVEHAETAAAAYFDHWMFDVMSVKRALPPGWTMHIEEVSAGVHRITAEAPDGRCISATGNNRLDLTSEVGQRVDALEARSSEEFFAERRLGLCFSESDGFVWADLVSRRRLRLPFVRNRLVAAKYGRAFTREDAGRSAVDRWKTEQAT